MPRLDHSSTRILQAIRDTIEADIRDELYHEFPDAIKGQPLTVCVLVFAKRWFTATSTEGREAARIAAMEKAVTKKQPALLTRMEELGKLDET